jgi:hypothetical protein
MLYYIIILTYLASMLIVWWMAYYYLIDKTSSAENSAINFTLLIVCSFIPIVNSLLALGTLLYNLGLTIRKK